MPELSRDAAWNISAPSTVGASGIRRSTPVIHSSWRERLDLRNGLAACPSHDVAFDTGLRDAILLPGPAQRPGRNYLDWHRANVFTG